MPYRAMNVALGVVGVAVLIALVVLGVNVYRSARTGPHWKRTLIIAGLVMLGLVGTTSPIACCYMPVVAYQPYHGQDLESVSNNLDFLDKQVAKREIQPDAARSTLENIEWNLRRSAPEEQMKTLTESDRAKLIQKKNDLQIRIDAMSKQLGD